MSNFIKITFVDYPRDGYGDYTPRYSTEIVNTRIIERVSRYEDRKGLRNANAEIFLSSDKKWHYCYNTYDALAKALIGDQNEKEQE